MLKAPAGLEDFLPTDLAWDHNGNIYALEEFSNRVCKFDGDGEFLFTFGGQGGAPGRFRFPHSIAADSAGRVFVSDRWNHRVQVFAPDGRLLDVIGGLGVAGGKFRRPSGMCVDGDGALWVCDTGNMRVQKICLSAKNGHSGLMVYSTFLKYDSLEKSLAPAFVIPQKIAVFGQGVAVLDETVGKIHVLGPSGFFVERPVFNEARENLPEAEARHAIRAIASSGECLFVMGESGGFIQGFDAGLRHACSFTIDTGCAPAGEKALAGIHAGSNGTLLAPFSPDKGRLRCVRVRPADCNNECEEESGPISCGAEESPASGIDFDEIWGYWISGTRRTSEEALNLRKNRLEKTVSALRNNRNVFGNEIYNLGLRMYQNNARGADIKSEMGMHQEIRKRFNGVAIKLSMCKDLNAGMEAERAGRRLENGQYPEALKELRTALPLSPCSASIQIAIEGAIAEPAARVAFTDELTRLKRLYFLETDFCHMLAEHCLDVFKPNKFVRLCFDGRDKILAGSWSENIVHLISSEKSSAMLIQGPANLLGIAPGRTLITRPLLSEVALLENETVTEWSRLEGDQPHGIARLDNGNFVVSTCREPCDTRLILLSPDGKFIKEILRRPVPDKDITGYLFMTRRPDGGILASGYRMKDAVISLDPEGNPAGVLVSGGEGPGQLMGAMGIACDNQGCFYVTDYLQATLNKYTSEGKLIYATETLPGGILLQMPNGLSFDGYGVLCISDAAAGIYFLKIAPEQE